MALSPIDAVCTKCSSKFNQVPKQSFLGFKILTCPACQEEIAYPLTKSRTIVYWFIFGWMAYVVFEIFAEGNLGNNGYAFGELSVPMALGFAALIALLKDRSIRKRLSKTINSSTTNVAG